MLQCIRKRPGCGAPPLLRVLAFIFRVRMLVTDRQYTGFPPVTFFSKFLNTMTKSNSDATDLMEEADGHQPTILNDLNDPLSESAASSSTMVPQFASFGVTNADLTTAINVLNAVAMLNPKHQPRENGKSAKEPTEKLPASIDEGIALYQQSNLRPFRKALAQCLDLHQRTMFQGASESDHYEQRVQQRSLKRQKMAERDLYQKHIATTALRKGRVERLQAALLEGASEERNALLGIQDMMIPDGHVDVVLSDVNSTSADDTDATTTILPCLRSCYVCKIRYRELHAFYDQLCPDCAAIGWAKRAQTANLNGRVAVVTGARVKIGFQVCLKLLRAGCVVVATTRFPNAAVDAYRKEADFDEWNQNLHVYGLDLRDVAGLEAFTRFLKQQFATTGIDILINNACQTIRRPSGYYQPAIVKEQQLWKDADEMHRRLLAPCIQFERLRRRIVLDHKHHPLPGNVIESVDTSMTAPHQLLTSSSEEPVSIDQEHVTFNGSDTVIAKSNCSQLSNGFDFDADDSIVSPFETTGLAHSAAMSQMIILPEDAGVNEDILPRGVSDINGQQLDLRSTNSWLLKMEEVSTPELMECLFVNAIAPFVLNARLKPLMTCPHDDNSRPDRYIINVSAMEGKVGEVRLFIQVTMKKLTTPLSNSFCF
jgi:NAD(P)-dependent dehydrogenase (short-subunit alcohol dehydrogenase family)